MALDIANEERLDEQLRCSVNLYISSIVTAPAMFNDPYINFLVSKEMDDSFEEDYDEVRFEYESELEVWDGELKTKEWLLLNFSCTNVN